MPPPAAPSEEASARLGAGDVHTKSQMTDVVRAGVAIIVIGCNLQLAVRGTI